MIYRIPIQNTVYLYMTFVLEDGREQNKKEIQVLGAKQYRL